MLQTSLFRSSEQAKEDSEDLDGLRDYQRERCKQIEKVWETKRSALLTMHCGAGKTKTAATIAKYRKGRVLWCAHRDFLCHQARVDLSSITKEYVDLEKANWRSSDARIVVASVATLTGDRLRSFAKDSFATIFMDEGHHGTAASWRAIPDHFSNAKVLYMSATPKRSDKTGLWNIIDEACEPFGIEEGLRWGSFVPIVPVSEFLDEISFEKIKTRAGDFALNELEAEITKSAAHIAQLTAKHMGDYQTIVYTPGVASAHATAATLRELGFTAAAVDANSDDITRKRVLESFKSRELQYIVNCGIYTEGLDVPGARGIVIARPTKSESLYIQMAGRGGRPAENYKFATAVERLAAIASSAKPNFKLLDITGHAGRHSMCTGTDLLGGARLKEAVELVKEKVSSGKTDGQTLDEMLDDAEKSIKEQEEESRRKIAQAAAAAEIRSRQSTFDPLIKLGFEDRNHGEEPVNADEPATLDDVEWLKKNRLPSKNVTKGDVRKLREQSAKWRRDGMATWRQRKLLDRYGLPVDIPFKVASDCIDHITKMQWNPSIKVLNELLGDWKNAGKTE